MSICYYIYDIRCVCIWRKNHIIEKLVYGVKWQAHMYDVNKWFFTSEGTDKCTWKQTTLRKRHHFIEYLYNIRNAIHNIMYLLEDLPSPSPSYALAVCRQPPKCRTSISMLSVLLHGICVQWAHPRIAGYSFLFENLTLPQLKKGRPSTYYVEILSSKFNCLCWDFISKI